MKNNQIEESIHGQFKSQNQSPFIHLIDLSDEQSDGVVGGCPQGPSHDDSYHYIPGSNYYGDLTPKA